MKCNSAVRYRHFRKPKRSTKPKTENRTGNRFVCKTKTHTQHTGHFPGRLSLQLPGGSTSTLGLAPKKTNPCKPLRRRQLETQVTSLHAPPENRKPKAPLVGLPKCRRRLLVALGGGASYSQHLIQQEAEVIPMPGLVLRDTNTKREPPSTCGRDFRDFDRAHHLPADMSN